MSKKREKKPVMAVKTIEEAEQVMSEYATADAKMAQIQAKMDEQITAIREKYSDQLQALSDTREDKLNTLHFFAESNAQLFDKKKSLQMSHGVLGFRTGTPKLKLLSKFTWGAVTEMLKDRLPAFVRIIEEAAKDKLLADRDNAEVNKHFAKCGIIVVQEESFFVELKKEEFANN